MPAFRNMLLLVAALALISTSPPSFLVRVRTAIMDAAPFSARFTQALILDGEVELEESGLIYLRDKQTLKWIYTEPEHKEFVFRNGEYRYYNREDNILTVGRVQVTSERWVWQLLFAEDLNLSVVGDADKRVISYHDERGDLDIRIEVDSSYLPVRVVQTEPLGTQTRYIFSGYQTRQRFGETFFDIDLPPDVEIIEQEFE